MATQNPNSQTKLTEFAPLSSEVRQSGGFFSKLFKKGTSPSGSPVHELRRNTSSASLDAVVAEAGPDDPPREDSPPEALAQPEAGDGAGEEARTEAEDSTHHRRTLTSVLKRLSTILDRRSQTPQAYKDSDFKQYWMPDGNCRECYECGDRFNTFRRRHHCRICGQIFCSRCCNQEVPGKIMGYTGFLRVCTYCCKVVLSYAHNPEVSGDLQTFGDDLRKLMMAASGALVPEGATEPPGGGVNNSYQELGFLTPTLKRRSRDDWLSSVFDVQPPSSRYNYLSLTYSYYRSLCKQRLGPPGGEDFVDTVHGNIPRMESNLISTCDRGEVWGRYTETFCCPSCYTLPCLNNGWCIQDAAGDYKCRCRYGIEGRHCEYIVTVIFIIGDPHYTTLDGQRISYQCLCKHTLVESTDAEAPYFRVDVRNQRRGSNDRVAFPKYYEVTVYDHVIRLSEGKEVYLDGTLVFPDVIYPGFKVIYNGRFLRLETDFGLAVEFDGRWTAVLKLPPDIEVHGMAGNNDGNPSNDLVTKEQVDVTDDPMSFSLIGNSWQVDDPEDPGCTAVAEANLPDCVEPLRTQFAAADVCGALVDASGAFSSCLTNAAMDPHNFFEACLYDMCANNGDAAIMEEARCGSVEAMAARCANLGHVIDWRDALNCRIPDCYCRKIKSPLIL